MEKITSGQFIDIDKYMKQLIDNGTLGCAVGLIYKDDEISYLNKFGFQNIAENKPIETNSIFRIASMTKPIVAVAALILLEKKKFKLDDPVSNFIPKFRELKVYKSGSKEDGYELDDLDREITIKDLFTHTGGFGYGWGTKKDVDLEYHKVQSQQYDKTLAEVIDQFLDIPLYHQPGSKWEYSISTDILGYLIEVISEKPLDEYLNEAIFQKLRMKDTGFFVNIENHSKLVSLYTTKDGKLSEIPTPRLLNPIKYFSGGGGLVSTLQDYTNFCSMLLNGGKFESIQLLLPKTVELMTSNQLADSIPPLDVMGDTRGLEEDRFGLGVGIKIRHIKYPQSIGTYYWSGIYTTTFIIDPKLNMFAIFLSQRSSLFDTQQVVNNFRDLVYRAILNNP